MAGETPAELHAHRPFTAPEFSLTGLVTAFVGVVVLLAIFNLVQRGRIR
jgi:uncharacterized membrane protein YeaQ/YmgE (transglycosylase-associated protein family)